MSTPLFSDSSEVLKFIKDTDVKFLDIRFTDLPTRSGVAVPSGEPFAAAWRRAARGKAQAWWLSRLEVARVRRQLLAGPPEPPEVPVVKPPAPPESPLSVPAALA